MKLFAFILTLSMLYTSVTPCHAEEHKQGEKCSHHNHNDSSNDEETDDYPCSPFCGIHSSVNSPETSPEIICEDIAFTENIEIIFKYTPTYYYLKEFSIWNPPKK